MGKKKVVLKQIGWITHESLFRLKTGGNSEGFVRVHAVKSNASKVAVFIQEESK